MPYSMTYRATAPPTDLTLSNIETNLYDSSWSLGKGVDHCLSPLQEELGELVYRLEAPASGSANDRYGSEKYRKSYKHYSPGVAESEASRLKHYT